MVAPKLRPPPRIKPKEGAVTPEKLLSYYRSSLADAALADLDLDRARIRKISRDELTQGRFSRENVKLAFEQARGASFALRSGDPKKRREKALVMPLLIAPTVLRRPIEHDRSPYPGRQTIAPLWIAACLSRDGTIKADPRRAPWIPRRCLEPLRGSGWTLGSLEDADRFRTLEGLPNPDDSWQDILQYSREFFRAVAGELPSEYEFEGFEDIGHHFLVKSLSQGAEKPLLALLDSMIDCRTDSEILSTLAIPRLREVPTPSRSPRTHGDDLHLGQMTNRFPLSPSQRESVGCALRLTPGEIQAINGPPGTGKTTLIQSIVASLWVQQALKKGLPKLIHICSTNNQAVTNVLDSLDAACAGEKEGFAGRWLPRLRSYGIFFPSRSRRKSETLSDHHVADVKGTTLRGFPEELESASYLEKALPFYLDHASQALSISPRNLTLEEALGALHERMSSLAEVAQQKLRAAPDFLRQEASGAWSIRGLDLRLEKLEDKTSSFAELRREVLEACRGLPWALEILDFLPPVQRRRDRWLTLPFLERGLDAPRLKRTAFAKDLLAAVDDAVGPIHREAEFSSWIRKHLVALSAPILRELLDRYDSPAETAPLLLDMGPRYELFQLAGRYWEGRWLQARARRARNKPTSRQSPSERLLGALRQQAMLMPAMVSTLFQAPRVFNYYDPQEKKGVPLIGEVDLLVVDEAGQVSPEVGAGVLPLARRAVIVGDVHQIEPIWGIERQVDEANFEEAGLELRDRHLDPLRCSSSNLLQLAQRATRWTSPSRDDGLFLSEHRRSVPAIISYCNELVYEGRLEPHREEIGGRILPALGWGHVKSEPRKIHGSWANAGEAWAIARWLEQHRTEIQGAYGGRPLEDLVGVVTPFAAQKREIQQALRSERQRKHGRAQRSTKEIASKAAPNIEVGTVHTFQGAERRIMIFSPVYSAESAPEVAFFDTGRNMLNVAVSRAQDSFIVFGDMDLFDPEGSRPSGILARHLFRSDDQEITDIPAFPGIFRKAEKIRGWAQQLTTLQEHVDALALAFQECDHHVRIISPYLSERAVQDDGILQAVENAHRRGVRIEISYSLDLNKSRPKSDQVAKLLRRAGAEVHAVNRVHSKVLAVDSKWYVVGSFNWLGAVRNPAHPFQRVETSIRVEDSDARRVLEPLWQEVEKRIKEKQEAIASPG